MRFEFYITNENGSPIKDMFTLYSELRPKMLNDELVSKRMLLEKFDELWSQTGELVKAELLRKD